MRAGFGSILLVMARRPLRPSDQFRITIKAVLLILSMSTVATVAQAPQSSRKATERVVRQYEKLIVDGALLTPEGWKKTSRIFGRSNPYPKDGEVLLTSQAGLIGENWVHGDRAEVERKWTDFRGSIDSGLCYKPAMPTSDVIPAILDYSLVFTNRHIDIEEGGATREVLGTWGWKIEGPQSERWATVEKAIIYVREMRDKSDDPAVKKNANRTIAILKRLEHRCGSGSAC
jgi:hypothetical protein